MGVISIFGYTISLLYILLGSLAISLIMFHHRLPKKIWKPFGILGVFLWSPIKKYDDKLFPKGKKEKEIKKTRFSKITSPIGKLFLLTISGFIILIDLILVNLLKPVANWFLSFPIFTRFASWLQKQHIIVLRIFIGIPFMAFQAAGAAAAFYATVDPLFALLIYATKPLYIVPFNYFNKVGAAKFSSDPWYLGFRYVIVSVLGAVKDLGAVEIVQNKIILIKNFFKNSNTNFRYELNIRVRLFKKFFSEVTTLRHMGQEIKEGDDIEVVYFTPEMRNKMIEYMKTPNEDLGKDVLKYLVHEFKVHSTEFKKYDVYINGELKSHRPMLREIADYFIKEFEENHPSIEVTEAKLVDVSNGDIVIAISKEEK